MDLKVTIIEEMDSDETPFFQEVLCDDFPQVNYSVRNLSPDSPEDAVIYRDLVSVYEYLDILKLEMELGAKGYTDIKVE